MLKRFTRKTTGIITFSDYKKVRARILYAFMIAVMVLSVTLMLLPPVWLFISSFKLPEELTAKPYKLLPDTFRIEKIAEVWNMISFGRHFLNTIIVVIGAVVCSVLFNGLLAYAFAIIKPKGYKAVYFMVLGSYMIPSVASIVPLFDNIVKLHLVNNYIPLWLMFGANAFFLIIFKNYFESLPLSLYEAAELDGCSKIKTFFKIILPLSMPIVGVISIFTMTAAWNDFLLPYLVLQDDKMTTVMVKIYNLQSTMGTVMGFGVDKLLMVLTISILPQIVIFALFQKQIMNSAASSGLKE